MALARLTAWLGRVALQPEEEQEDTLSMYIYSSPLEMGTGISVLGPLRIYMLCRSLTPKSFQMFSSQEQ